MSRKTTIKINKTKRSAWNNELVLDELYRVKRFGPKFRKIDNLSAQDYMTRFKKAADKHGFKHKELSAGRAMFTLGTGKMRVSMISGIHGEERSGPVALLSWLELTPKGRLIGDHVSLFVCPLVGHQAWNMNEREEKKNLNLNQVWRWKSAPKYVQELRTELTKFKSDMYMDFHEDSTIEDKEPYVFREKKTGEYIKIIQTTFSLSKTKGVFKRSNPEYHGTSEDFALRLGCKNTTTIETPLDKYLRFRVGFNLALLKYVSSKQGLQADIYELDS